MQPVDVTEYLAKMKSSAFQTVSKFYDSVICYPNI